MEGHASSGAGTEGQRRGGGAALTAVGCGPKGMGRRVRREYAARKKGGPRVRVGRQRREAGGGARLGRSAEALCQAGERTEGGQLCGQRGSGGGPHQGAKEEPAL